MTAVLDDDAIEGVDVSRFQGPDLIDWGAVYNAGKRWTYIQSCRSVDSPDPMCLSNIEGAIKAGLLLGLYQRVFPELGTPEQHAYHFLSCFNRVAGALPDVMLPFAVDYEQRIPGGGAWCMRYIEVIRQALGIADFTIYSSGSWFKPDGYIGQEAWEGDPDIHLWVAHTDRFPYPGWAPGKPQFQHLKTFAHQYDQDGMCPGIPPGRALLDVSVKPLPLVRR